MLRIDLLNRDGSSRLWPVGLRWAGWSKARNEPTMMRTAGLSPVWTGFSWFQPNRAVPIPWFSAGLLLVEQHVPLRVHACMRFTSPGSIRITYHIFLARNEFLPLIYSITTSLGSATIYVHIWLLLPHLTAMFSSLSIHKREKECNI